MTDIKNFAQIILNLTKNRGPNDTYPLPVKKLRALASYALEQESIPLDMPPLTDVETKTYAAVKADVAQGIQPTLESISKRLGLANRSCARGTVNNLIKHGYLARKGSRKQLVVVSLRK